MKESFRYEFERLTKGMTDLQISQKIGFGITQQAVNRWRNQNRDPHPLMQWAILDKLMTSVVSEESGVYQTKKNPWVKASKELSDKWENANAGQRSLMTTALQGLWPEQYRELIRWLNAECEAKKNIAA